MSLRFSSKMRGTNSVFVSVTRRRGVTNVHIRKYLLVEGKQSPSKSGAILKPIRWKTFTSRLDLIKKRVDDLDTDQDVDVRQHLGGNWYVSVTEGFNCVDFRQFWLPPGEDAVVGTKRGIALKISEFKRLVDLTDEINASVPGFEQIELCIERNDHLNQEGALRCSECNPNDFQNW